MKHIKPNEVLDIRQHEDEYILQNYVLPKVCNDSAINIMNLRKSKLYEKFRDSLGQGIPILNAYLFTYHYCNNKPSIWLFFKLEEDNSKDKTECIQKCTSLIPKVISKAQMIIVKNGLNNMLNMNFTKKIVKG